MKRVWFYRKKEKRTKEVFTIALTVFLISYFFLQEYIVYISFAILASILLINKDTKKEFNKRKSGLSIEDKEGVWLENILHERNIKVLRSLNMKYGDVDIYIPSMKIVIDVKSYRHIDSRTKSPGNFKSLRRQINYTGAKFAILWLPYGLHQGCHRINNYLYIISGKKILVDFIDQLNITSTNK